MLALLGDIHGGFDGLRAAERRAKDAGATALVQVGDFGWYSRLLDRLREPRLLPVYFIDGNHEDHELLFGRVRGDVTEMWGSGLFYVRRGAVLELDGRRIAFLGGAGSIDKQIRLANRWHWSELEQITDADVARLEGAGPVDLMIAHCPPQRTIATHFETPEGIAFKVRAFGVPPDWSDPSAVKVETAWLGLGAPPLYCGHMHRRIADDRVRILDIEELLYV
jgi:hypothetical protein